MQLEPYAACDVVLYTSEGLSQFGDVPTRNTCVLQSASLGLAIAGALALGYPNMFVTAPLPENLRTLFGSLQLTLQWGQCVHVILAVCFLGPGDCWSASVGLLQHICDCTFAREPAHPV